ncbi:MAG: sugar ABC transporter permease [Lachnospiraceae bacterium]|mgnify:CR=1 FL=1|jgi:multiple sugar transport system permease protein|nr:sugar ABC transporter permease [Lachnospiraceae bacterium]
MAGKGRSGKVQSRENRNGYLFVMPWILGFFLFTLLPMVFSAILSLCEWDIVTGLSTIEFVGLENFTSMFKDPKFWQSLKVTFKFCLITIPCYQIASLFVAFLLAMDIKGMKIFRVVYFLPSIIPTIAATMIWTRIFAQDGILNKSLSVIGIKGPAWLTDRNTALYALMIMGLWGVGNTIIIYLSGLQGVSEELKEAARVDGAKGWQIFFKITVPMISPTIFFNVVMAVIGSFQYFTQAYVMTEGGPMQSTLFYNLYLYQKAYKEYQMGYASAMAWVMFIIIMLFTMLVIKSSSFWVYYQNDDKL